MLAAVLALAGFAAAQVPFRPVVVYGSDHRKDLYEVEDERLRALSDSVVALVDASRVKIEGSVAKLRTRTHGRELGLCRGERFYEQRTAAQCSGALVGPDLVLTAGHCLPTAAACRKEKFVFGFALRTPGQDLSSVPKSDVYGCARLLASVEVKRGADWALVRLDRAVSGRKPLAIDPRRPAVGAPLVLAGYPEGLPLKIAASGTVRDDPRGDVFHADVDAFAGNSGSPVLSADALAIVGVLSGGPAPDYVWRRACQVPQVCADPRRCEGGEDVSRATAIRLPSRLRPRLAEGLLSRAADVTAALEKR